MRFPLSFGSFKTRATLLSLFFFSVGIWSLDYYSGRILQEELQQQLGDQQFSTAAIVVAAIDEEFSFRLRSLEKVAASIPAASMIRFTELQQLLESRPLLQLLFDGGYFAVTKDGTARASFPASMNVVGTRFLDRDFIQAALQDGKSTIGKPVAGNTEPFQAIYLCAPILDAQGSIVGALAGIIDLSRSGFIDRITGQYYGKSGNFIIFDPRLRLIVKAGDRELTLAPFSAAGARMPLQSLAELQEGYSLIPDRRGERLLVSVKQIPVTGWSLAITLPAAEAFAPIAKMKRNMHSTALLLTLLTGFLIWWMLKRQLSPLHDAVTTLGSLSESDQPLVPLPVPRKDEVGLLLDAFNRLLETVAARERKLVESEALHRSLLQTASSGIWLVDSRMRILQVNQSYCRMSGYSEQELLGMTVFDLEVSLSADEISDWMERIRREGIVRFETRHRRKDGTIYDVEANMQFRPVEDGQTLAFLQDITERKRMETELRNEQQRLASIILGAHVGTWEWNVQTGETIFNERWAEILGYALAEISPVSIDTWARFAHPEDLAISQALLERHFRGELAYYDCEVRMRHRNGSWIWILTRGRVTQWTGDGKPLWMLGVHTDITERKRAETHRAMAHEVLLILSEPGDLHELMERVLFTVKTSTDVDAVGIRLQQGEDFPYFVQDGFPPCFLLAENSLLCRTEKGAVCRNEDGKPALECTCGLVLSGKTDPASPLFSSGGSAWTNDSFPFLEVPEDQDPRWHPRNNCIHMGYASVALIPIRAKDQIIGILQLNDRRKGRFSGESIASLEDATRNIGEALMRKQAENARQVTEKALEQQRDLGMILLGTDNLEEALRLCLETAQNITRMEAGGFYYVEESGGMRLVCHRGISPEFTARASVAAPDSPLIAWAKRGQPFYGQAESLPQSTSSIEFREGLRTLYHLPILRGERLLGLLSLGSRHALDLPQSLCHLMESIRNQVGIFIERNHAQRDLHQANADLEKRVGQRTEQLTFEIEERRRAEARLLESERRFRDLVETIPNWVWEIDSRGNFTYCSPQCRKLLGYTPEEILGQPFFSLLNSRDPAGLETSVELFQERGPTARSLECEVRNKDGNSLVLEINGIPVRNDRGQLTGYRGLAHDLTERKRIEAELRLAKEAADSANLAKSRFLANLSHEIRTPMNAILGFTQLMQRDPAITPQQSSQLRTINHSGEHLLRLINDILDMSKIEAGRMQVSVGECDLHTLLEEVEGIYRQRAGEKGLTFRTEFPHDLPRFIRTDTRKVHQMFFNLLSNAVKFTLQGGIRVNLSFHADCSPQDERRMALFEFTVSDTGIGIAEHELGRVFDPFEQTESGQSQGGGTGLGMAISRQLARLLGGDLTVTSHRGVGSVFRLTFQAELLEAVDPAAFKRKDIYRVQRLKPGSAVPRVLIVDDIESNRRVLRDLLELIGFRTTEAVHGAEAVEHCERDRPDLVLMDRRMPVLGGLEATREIRQSPGGSRIRILIISASVLGMQEDEWKAIGADGFIGKPFGEEDLLERIADLLGVEYLYEKATPEIPVKASLRPENVSVLPPDLLAQLQKATEEGDASLLRELLAREVEPKHPELGRALGELVRNYEYPSILSLLQKGAL